jgi:formylmethanofuran dehydrogenase subunit E
MCKLLEDFHGHTCAGSLMGLRLGLAARDALREQGKVEAKIFLQACPVDGAQVATGATCGNKTFTIEDRNDCRLILTHVKTGKQVEALLTPKAADNGQRFRALSGEAKNYTAGSPCQY